ncbi:MAG: EAL domain-containing protein [Lacrimispora sp.]
MFIARQPIFNRALKIYGYELLFRSSETSNAFSNATSLSATAVVFGGLFEQGIDKIVGKEKAFVNFDYEFIMSDMIELINPETLVIEVLETVKFDSVLLARIQELRSKGYKIALDDFDDDYFGCPAVSMSDIIKYDILATPLDTLHAEVRDAISKNRVLLAEKVETEEEYQKAKRMGFQLFQGYFFSKPKIVPGTLRTKRSPKTVYIQLLKELKKKDFSFDKITKFVESDVNLSYRLLCIISHKKESQYDSIRNALVHMGRNEIERWISVVMLQNVAADKPDEVFKLSLLRSKFGEYIAAHSSLKGRKDEAAMMFLFSLLDVILDSSMKEALQELAISNDITDALINGTGIFKPLCMLMRAYENGDWNEVEKYAKAINVSSESLTIGYISAIGWASKIMYFYN